MKFTNALSKSTQIAPSEVKAALTSFLFIFILMASYMIMKPVRDALPSDWSDVSLAQQWTYTFIVSTLALLSALPLIFVLNRDAAKKGVNRLSEGTLSGNLFSGSERKELFGNPETPFKSKPIIDIAVYRGGDVFWIWVVALLGVGWMNLGLTGLLYAGVFVSLLLGGIGIYLGRKHEYDKFDPMKDGLSESPSSIFEQSPETNLKQRLCTI